MLGFFPHYTDEIILMTWSCVLLKGTDLFPGLCELQGFLSAFAVPGSVYAYVLLVSAEYLKSPAHISMVLYAALHIFALQTLPPWPPYLPGLLVLSPQLKETTEIYLGFPSLHFQGHSSVQSLSHVWLFVTPWTAACQTSVSITNFWSLLRLMSIKSVMPSNHHPLSPPFHPAFSLSQHQGLFKWVSSSH